MAANRATLVFLEPVRYTLSVEVVLNRTREWRYLRLRAELHQADGTLTEVLELLCIVKELVQSFEQLGLLLLGNQLLGALAIDGLPWYADE